MKNKPGDSFYFTSKLFYVCDDCDKVHGVPMTDPDFSACLHYVTVKELPHIILCIPMSATLEEATKVANNIDRMLATIREAYKDGEIENVLDQTKRKLND